MSIQIPVIVGQGISVPTDLSSVTALIIFFQTISGAIWVSVAQALFANDLLSTVPRNAPGVDPHKVAATGATELRSNFPAAQLPGIIRSYMDGLKDAYILAVALAGTGVLISTMKLIINWRVLPRGAEAEAIDAQAAEEQREEHVL